MVDFNSIRFWAKDSAGRLKGIAGSTITVALATLARGLQNAGSVDINATDAGTSTVIVRNSTAGQVANLSVTGAISSASSLLMANGTGYLNQLTSAVTAARVWTFPDSSGTVALKGINNAFSTTQSVTGAVNASSTVSVQNNGSTQSITLSGSPTGNRVVTFPDADITIGPGSGYLGSYTNTELNAITPSGFAWAFCNNIAGSGGGTTGVPAYWTPVTGVWLRFATDTTI